MSNIASLTARVVSVQNTTLATSYGAGKTVRDHLFVKLETEDGVTGFAEGSPLPHFSGEQASTMKAVLGETLAPALKGLSLFDLENVQVHLDRAIAGHNATKAAIVNAVYDALGKTLSRPVCDLLGGRLRPEVKVAGAIGIVPPNAVLARARELYETGVRTFKLKVGTDLERDTEAVKVVREEFGSAVEIRADANAGFTRAAARRFLERTASFDLQYLEQPLDPRDLSGLAELRRVTTTPIAIDESLFSASDAIAAVRAGAADVFVIKLIKLGGLLNARKVASIAEASGVTCVAVSPYETDLGGSANLHLAASSRAFAYACEVGAGVSAVSLPGIGRLQPVDGAITVPDQPGLGVAVAPEFFAGTQAPHGMR